MCAVRARPGKDHPRSRGVYSTWVCTTGSIRWIIPARAGFTPPDTCAWASTCGSSPLARGLPAHLQAAADWAVDHPRSRGVYSSPTPPSSSISGSSPLARGLHAELDAESAAWGIIPARAGFTTSTEQDSAAVGDHPRSRGVYCMPVCLPRVGVGSSPLARGLRGPAQQTHHVGRIIPARAGFTPARRCRGERRADHPRSRGVYPRALTTPESLWGSSPLARGLPRPERQDHQGRRIIPARAGFTGSPEPTGEPAPDHPRSRGVYSATS